MKISFNDSDQPFKAQDGWHILTVADPGFSALTIYGEEYGLDRMAIDEFIDKVNHTNQTGSLHPKAPLSAIPCKYVRELSNSSDQHVFDEFISHINEFLSSNSKVIKSENLAIDLRVSPSPISQQYIDATVEALRAYKGKLLKNVIIF